MDHETSPLFDMKMPKAKPIAKLMDTYLRSNPKLKPLGTNENIMIVSIPKGFGILILVAKSLVLILQLRFD